MEKKHRGKKDTFDFREREEKMKEKILKKS